MLNITKLYDQPGWAYDFIAREMKLYSKCRITPAVYNNFKYDLQDIIIISGPNIAYSESAVAIPRECKKRGIKVIGQYCGEVDIKYDYADLIVTISPQLYLYAKNKYKDTPVIFLPESIDTNYFVPPANGRPERRFIPGWAGGAGKAIKRTRLFDQSKFPVKIQSDHGQQHFKVGRSQAPMRAFYDSIDCFVCVSETECMPRVILEAMASGLPVISTDVGGVKLLIPDEYLIPVLPEEVCVEEMNKRLYALAESSAMREALGRINRAWCERLWSWEANMPIWDEVFYYLHQGNIKKVLEIGDSCIGSFAKFFEPCEKYTNQIEKFQKTKVEAKTYIAPNPFETLVSNLMTMLAKSKCNYWLAKESCLDTLNHQRLVTNPGVLKIGVNTSHDLHEMRLFLRKLGAVDKEDCLYLQTLKIYVEIEGVTQTKTMILYGKAVPVPLPVVPYLQAKFGPDWQVK